MLRYRGSSLIRSGLIGVVLIILVITVGLQPQRLLTWATSVRHQALFTEAAGLAPGNDVVVKRDIPWMVELYQQGRLKLDELITGRWTLEQVNEAMADTMAGNARRNVIVLDHG